MDMEAPSLRTIQKLPKCDTMVGDNWKHAMTPSIALSHHCHPDPWGSNLP